MNGIEVTRIQSRELATSTCTPTGGGASNCSYSYRETLTYSTTTIQNTEANATTTTNLAGIETIWLLFTLGVMVTVGVAYIAKKLV